MGKANVNVFLEKRNLIMGNLTDKNKALQEDNIPS